MVGENAPLWRPDSSRIAQANVTAFMRWLHAEGHGQFLDYPSLWQWSVDHLEEFWESIWRYFKIESSSPYETVLASHTMPGAVWFPGARLNYAQHILRNEREGSEALISYSELRAAQQFGWTRLGAEVRILATRLRELGVKPGDRVVGYLPNIPEAIVALLATTAIGAVWSSCSPDLGVRSTLDRFSQIAPKVLFSVDGYRYKGRDFDRRPELGQVIRQLDSLELVVHLPYLRNDDELPAPGALQWRDLMDRRPVAREDFQFEQVPFDHPLWILFSSGTTGPPKAIVHGHGGITLEQMKLLAFHMDLRAGDRMFYYTTTGWMVWNFLASALMAGVVPVLYDGHPMHPDTDFLWQLVSETGTSFFGASPSYIQQIADLGIVPKEKFDLSRLRSIMLAGSPVTAEVMAWFYRNVSEDLWVGPGSGGTDICTGLVGGIPTLPVYAGEIQARHLAVDAHAFNEEGKPVVDEVGELVIRQPMPSMPVAFWNDPEGRRYRESYFQEFPGVWRHGDFFKINARGGCFVLGRSDATLNRFGVRIGTAEVYRCLEGLPGVADSLIINLDLPGGRFFMPLFVRMADGYALDDGMRDKICDKLRTEYSPRHVPDRVYEVSAIPYTMTGKKMEVPVRKILMGWPPEKIASRDAMGNPDSLDYFIRFRSEQQDLLR
jgi:acetoacetyl-CoA synthetase